MTPAGVITCKSLSLNQKTRSFMEFIFDSDPNLQSQIISPNRVYKCEPCNRTAYKKDVLKRNGKRFCIRCGGEVQDVTDTTTGHDFMEIVNL